MKFVALVLVALMLVCYGCASKPAQTGQKTMTAEEQQARLEQEEALKRKEREARISEENLAKTRAERERLEREKALQEKKVDFPVNDIYFEYDSYNVKPEDMADIKAVGEWMKLNNSARIVIEGHCDERGTVEYNLALGQKRAEVVKNHLVKFGIEEKRVRVISFGKEVPAVTGHTEDAWAKNRRAHFVLDQKG